MIASAAAIAPAMIAPLRFLKSLLIASRTTGPPWGRNSVAAPTVSRLGRQYRPEGSAFVSSNLLELRRDVGEDAPDLAAEKGDDRRDDHRDQGQDQCVLGESLPLIALDARQRSAA